MTANTDKRAPMTAATEKADRFATLTFEREAAAPVSVLWQAWTASAARQLWAAPTPEVTVEFVEADLKALISALK